MQQEILSDKPSLSSLKKFLKKASRIWYSLDKDTLESIQGIDTCNIYLPAIKAIKLFCP